MLSDRSEYASREEMNITIKCEQLSKEYKIYSDGTPRSVWAISNISLNVYDGDRLGIIGLNGSGKTTLMKIIGGAIKPTSGRVMLSDKPVMLSHFDSLLHPDLTGVENVKLQLRLTGITPVNYKVCLEEIASFSELGQFLYQPVKKYSSGMMLRLSFSILKVITPSILLMDEVLSAGDIVFQQKMEELMKKHFASCRSVIMASHNLQEIASFCNRVIMLEKGKIIKEGSPDELIQDYLISGTQAKIEHVFSREAVWINQESVKQQGPICLIRVGLFHAEQGHVPMRIDNATPLNWQVEFTHNYHHKVKLALDLHTIDQILLITTSPNAMQEYIDGFSAGKVSCTALLPSRVLNTGIYSISLSFFDEENKLIALFSRVCFFKITSDDSTATPESKSKGLIRPPVIWKVL